MKPRIRGGGVAVVSLGVWENVGKHLSVAGFRYRKATVNANGRPVVRTGRLEAAELAQMKSVFGTATAAWERLRLRGALSLWVFRMAWRGQYVQPRVVRAIRHGWERVRRDLLVGMGLDESGQPITHHTTLVDDAAPGDREGTA